MFEWVRKIMKGMIMETENKLSEEPPFIGKESVDLILDFEGIDQPSKRPPGESGITLGYGFDLGFYNLEEFREAWERHLSPNSFKLLSGALGKTGQRAEAIKSRFISYSLNWIYF